jgi:hypothetical protein
MSTDPNCCFTLRVKTLATEPTIVIRAFDDLGWDSAGRVKLSVEVRQLGQVIFPRGQLHCALHGTTDGIAARELVLALVAMRPGGTDADYFADYTPDQIAWAERHGEYLGYERESRYCDSDGNVRKTA